MNKIAVMLGALMMVPTVYAENDWFARTTPLAQAHQHLLTGELSGMFDSMVEVWQNADSTDVSEHLNALALQGLELDCGKGFTTQPLPKWIKSVTLRRIEIQSPGRDAYQFILDVSSTEEIQEVYIRRWVDKAPSGESTLSKIQSDDVTNYIRRYNIPQKLTPGLYRVSAVRLDGSEWSQWIILEEPEANHSVHWVSQDEWKVVKSALPNSYCPLPKLNVSLYSFDEGKYVEIWHKAYESDYPLSLPRNVNAPSRYILAVSMNYQRWQGPILIEQSQVISKTYDVTDD
ncbi:DUF2861 family protein [Vibrio sp. RC27]